MRRLVIVIILLFAVTVQAQERQVEDWMVWLYLPESETLVFSGFYTEEQDAVVNYIPVSFERRLQLPDKAHARPDSIIVSDDASTLAYVVRPDSNTGGITAAQIVVSEILNQGFYVHEIPTFNANSVSVAFHSTAQIQELGRTLYHKQQRLPALASQYPDRERTIAYAFQNQIGTWQIEVFDVNAEELLLQLDTTIIPELDAQQIIVKRYHDDALEFAAIKDGTEILYEWSFTDSTIRELPAYLLSTQFSDSLASSNETLEVDGNSLLYHQNPDASGKGIFKADAGEALYLPRFIQDNERIAVGQSSTSITVLERDGTVLSDVFIVPNLTQLVGVPTGFVYVIEGEAFSTVMYYHSDDDDFTKKELFMWGDFEEAIPIEVIYVHHGAE